MKHMQPGRRLPEKKTRVKLTKGFATFPSMDQIKLQNQSFDRSRNNDYFVSELFK